MSLCLPFTHSSLPEADLGLSVSQSVECRQDNTLHCYYPNQQLLHPQGNIMQRTVQKTTQVRWRLRLRRRREREGVIKLQLGVDKSSGNPPLWTGYRGNSFVVQETRQESMLKRRRTRINGRICNVGTSVGVYVCLFLCLD